MGVRIYLKRLALFVSTVLGAGATSGCADETRVMAGVQESGYVMPFPLQQGGEQIDLLVRVRDSKRPYQFNLILVARNEWPEEKKDVVRRIDRGFVTGTDGIAPYPIKLRIRIDAADINNDVHVDEVVSERHSYYVTQAENDTAIWFAQRFYVRSFPPGIYRVRVDNLAPIPQFDFQTLFEFERDNRKY